MARPHGFVSFARDSARELRRVPGVRSLLERTDDARRAQRIAKSGIVDTELYAVLLGRESMTAEEAAEHYVRWGQWAGLTIHPLLDDGVLRASVGGHRPPIFEYLWTRAFATETSPVWSATAYLLAFPDAAEDPAGPVGHLMRRVAVDPDTHITVRTATGPADVAWSAWRRETIDTLRPWADADALRRARRVTAHFSGVKQLGEWTGGRKRPTVSIVLATWNRAGDLRDAVESVLAQLWEQWELLIVDDGSTDDTPIIARLLAERDNRIRYLQRPHRGVGATRNAGIAAATGEFVTFLDSDNEWEPRFLHDMMVAMDAGGDNAAFATLEIDDGNRALYRESAADLLSLEHGNVVDLNVLVCRLEAVRDVGGFDEDLARAIDYDLVLRLARRAPIRHIPILGAVYENRAELTDRISTSEPLGWNSFVRIKHLVDWNALNARHLLPGADVVVLSPRHDPILERRIAAAVELAAAPDLDVHLVMLVPDPGAWLHARQLTDALPNVHLHMFPGDEPFAYVATLMLAVSTRERFVLIDGATDGDATAIRALVDRVDPARHTLIAPLGVHLDGTIRGVGLGFAKPGDAPVEILLRHPIDDAAALGREVSVPAPIGRSFALPTRDLIEAKGLDPLLFNAYELAGLAVRLRELFPTQQCVTACDIRVGAIDLANDFAEIDPEGTFGRIRYLTRNTPRSDFDSLLRPLSLRVAGFTTETKRGGRLTLADSPGDDSPPLAGDTFVMPATRRLVPILTREHRAVPLADGTMVPKLRWAIRIAAPYSGTGAPWGDTHFARSLADALERLGQDVVIDHHEVTTRESASLDDVTLVIRGLDRVVPVTAGVSILWIISHPDMVTRNEVAHFDRVFAASEKWSAQASERWRTRITPLLQCTDPHRFHPTGEARRGDIVFVGKSRGVPRPVVVAPVSEGIPVRVFGEEWEDMLPEGTVESAYVPNEVLAPLYEGAGVVLNDHWNDMREDGFISNRLFDIVASGGRAVSDDVEGLAEIFGDAVHVFSDSAQLVEDLSGDLDRLFPDADEIAAISQRVRRDHSFDARARTLLDTAIEVLDLAAPHPDDAAQASQENLA